MAAVRKHVLRATQISTAPSSSVSSHTKSPDPIAAPKPRACCSWFWNYVWSLTWPSALDVSEKTALLEGPGTPQSTESVIEEAPPAPTYDADFWALIMQQVVDECRLCTCHAIVFSYLQRLIRLNNRLHCRGSFHP